MQEMLARYLDREYLLEKEMTPLQYYRLENPMDDGAWRATVLGVTKSRAQQTHIQNHRLTSQV